MSHSSPLARFRAPLARLSVITLVIAGIGCKDHQEGPVARISPPDLQLVSAGNEPRQVLRYHAAPGTTTPIEVVIDVELTAGEMGGPMPTIIMAMTLSVTGTLPGGEMKVRATIDNLVARNNPKSKVPAAALQGAFKQLVGLAIDSTLSPSGRLHDSRLDRGGRDLPKDMDSQIASLVASFESTMMPLPDEAVGVGAVWRNSRPIEQNGLKLKAVNTIALAGLHGNALDYTAETDMHGDDQTITQGEITITVSDILGNGGGKGSIDLGSLAMTSELTAQFQAKMKATGDSSPTTMEMATLMKVHPLDKAAAPAPSPAPAPASSPAPAAAPAQGAQSAP